MHQNASTRKAEAISCQGAEIRRIAGTYDDSVRIARDAADSPGCILIADTSESEFEQVPAEIIHGYSVMILELLAQIGRLRMPTHVFVQGGVGGLAAAVAGSLAEALGRERPTLVVVEPCAAACLMASAREGVPTHIGGELATAMEMLSCGKASPVAWFILRHRADAFITIDDDAACRTVELLKDCDATGEAVPIDAGPSGAAGLAGLVAICRQTSFRESLKLGPEARVLTFGTEAGELSHPISASGGVAI
jgi:diaminopropionate ammonia-lyase